VIFVTIGGQLPFDRLVYAVDRWAGERGGEDVFAQIGDSSEPPTRIRWERFLTPTDFAAKASQSDVIVSHAGMGSILTALELREPIVVMPRRAHLGEHRNDHQWATVKHLAGGVDISVAEDEVELAVFLGRLADLRRPTERRSAEYERLLHFLRRTVGS